MRRIVHDEPPLTFNDVARVQWENYVESKTNHQHHEKVTKLFSSLSTAQLRRYLDLTEEDVVERLDEDTLAEEVARVVDISDRFMADPRDVSPTEVTEAKAMLTAMRHYEAALAPIRRLRVDWREPLASESDIPPAPRYAEE